MTSRKNKSINIHKYFMQIAFNQARKALGRTGENPAVGCVVVKNNSLLSIAHTNFNGRPHAEKIALSKKKINFKSSSLYTTLEPCSHYGKTPPCTSIIIRKKLKSVYFSMIDPDERSCDISLKKLNKHRIKVIKHISKSLGKSFYKDYLLIYCGWRRDFYY